MIVISINAKAYRNTATFGTPVWDEIPGIKDLQLALEMAEFDVTPRGAGGFGQEEPTLLRASAEFDMPWDPADTDLTALRTAWLARTKIEFLILDGGAAVAGSQGLRATMKVFNFSRSENLEEALMVNVTIKPCHSTDPASWFIAP